MEVFNKYLRGKQFILFTDHKPLEKIGPLAHKDFKLFAEVGQFMVLEPSKNQTYTVLCQEKKLKVTQQKKLKIFFSVSKITAITN